MECSRTQALHIALFPPLVRTDGANYHGGDAQMYFDKHKAAPLRCNDKFINWELGKLVIFFFFPFLNAIAQHEGLSANHRCKRLICRLQVGEMKINT